LGYSHILLPRLRKESCLNEIEFVIRGKSRRVEIFYNEKILWIILLAFARLRTRLPNRHCRPDHLGPSLGIFGNEFTEIGG
jgi:hypothetical protein